MELMQRYGLYTRMIRQRLSHLLLPKTQALSWHTQQATFYLIEPQQKQSALAMRERTSHQISVDAALQDNKSFESIRDRIEATNSQSVTKIQARLSTPSIYLAWYPTTRFLSCDRSLTTCSFTDLQTRDHASGFLAIYVHFVWTPGHLNWRILWMHAGGMAMKLRNDKIAATAYAPTICLFRLDYSIITSP